MKILGVDYGDRRIGIAISDALEMLAAPLTTYSQKSMREGIDAVAGIAASSGAKLIVLGLPLNMDGSEGERASKTRAFGRNLQKVTGLPVEYVDERLTSLEAEEILINNGVRRENRKGKLDMISAQLILQSYLDSPKEKKRSVTEFNTDE